MSNSIDTTKITPQVIDAYVAKARRLRAEAYRDLGRHIAADVRALVRHLTGRRAV